MNTTSQGALHFGAGIDLTRWRRDMDTMRRDILGLSRDTQNQTRSMDSAFKSLSVGIASYFSISALRSFVTELVNVRGEFQKTEIAFSTMLKSEAKATELMGQMVDLAAKTPFSLQEVSSGAKQLLAFQIPANEVVDTLTRMGNIAAGLGVPLSRINLVYGQVKAKGKLMGDDLRQFTEAGIPMVAELATKFKKSTAEISAMVSAGKIGFKDVQDVLFGLTNQGGMFFNLMEKQSKSLSGQVSNLGDTWDQMLNKIGESQEGFLSDGIQGLTYLVEHYQDVGKAIATLVEIYGAYRAALIFTSALQTRMAAPAIIQGFGNLIKIIRGVTVAQTALNTASLANPYVLLATLIAGLVAVTYNYRQELGELLGIIEEQTAAQKVQEKVNAQYNETFGKGVVSTKSAIESLIYTIRSEYSTLQQREQAYNKLIALDSSFVGTLDNQFRATNRLGFAFENLVKNLQKYAMAQAEVAVRADAFKNFAETEMNLGINRVKMEDAEAQIKKLADQFNSGKITMEQYSDATKKIGWGKLKQENIELTKTYKEQRSEKQLISKLDERQIKDLQKGNNILKAQLAGGKVQGKTLTEAGKTALKKQLENNENILNLRFGIQPELKLEPQAVKGWAQQIQDQIDALEAEKPSASKARYFQIEEEVKRLNEMLNPKKVKVDNKQIAEFLPLGSIIELERRAQLINDAIKYAVDGQVKLRKLDKYGNDKDKKGNQYLTGEVISKDEAENRVKEINAMIKKMQKKSFDEELSEMERQWKIRYQLTKHYGEETAKAMFPDLKGDSYYSEMNNLFKNLDGKYKSGITLTDEELANWSKLKGILSSLNGTKDPFSQFTEDLDKDLGKFKTAGEKVDFLTEKLYKLTDQEISSGYKSEIFQQLNALKLEEQKQYQQLLDDHQNFNDRKINIERDTAIAIKKIREDQSLPEEKKKGLEDSIDKRSKEEISQLAVDELTKSQAWMALYGNIDELSAYQMDVLLKELEAKKGNLAKVLTPVDFSILLKNFRDVKVKIADENPFLGLFNSLTELFSSFGTQSEEAGQQAFDGFEKASEGIKGTLKAAKGIITSLAPAREYMSDAANDAIDTIDQVATMGIVMLQSIQGTVKAVKAALDKASWSNWITAIISIIYTVIKAIVSLFSWIAGNKTKKINREIKSWQAAIDGLKNSYEDLQRVIEKTAGEGQLKMQRSLIENLKEQQRILEEIRKAEQKKKKSDQDKISSYTNEIHQINVQIEQLVDDFKLSILTVDFKDFAQSLSDALVEAFGKGEDAALSFEKVADEVMKNAVVNALKIKFLQPVAEEFVDKLYTSMGFGGNGGNQAQKDTLATYKAAIAEIDNKLKTANSLVAVDLNGLKKYYQELINKLQAEIAAGAMSGTFDGLTPEEIELLTSDYKNDPRIKAFLEGIKNIEGLFNTTTEAAQGLKGDIKGITEKTAGALEAQFNAMRINVVAMFQLAKQNHTVQNTHTVLLSQIEINTRNLIGMRKDLAELNSKVKKNSGLAGIP